MTCTRFEGCYRLVLVALVFTVVPGCPTGDQGGNGNANGNGNGSGSLSGEIITLRSNRQVSALEPFLSILYSVTNAPAGTEIAAFFVAVSGTGPEDYVEVGDRVALATGLQAGENQAFNFLPALAGPGRFQIGLVVTPPGVTEQEILSTGLVEVQGVPNPIFVQPSESLVTVIAGTEVFLSFDAGDPEGLVQWRLFLLTSTDRRDVTPDLLGEQLSVGSGNVGSFTLVTSDLEPGDHQLGLSATDSGLSISSTVGQNLTNRIVTNLNGPIIRIVDPSTQVLPTLAFSAPGTSNVSLFLDEAFTLQFIASLREDGATGSLDLFYDSDRTASNGITLFEGATELPVSTSSFAFPTNLPAGTYNIGGTLRRDGTSPATVTAYAGGTITVVRTPTLQVTEPNTRLPIMPTTEGGTVNSIDVKWSTNVPPSSGLVDVFARALNADGQVVGPELPILAPTSTSTTSAKFSSDVSGVFRVFVRITFNSVTQPRLQVSAPQPVRVSSLPRILWLGSLAASNPAFEGAIFGGVNFEDNAGSTFSPAGDLDDDGLGDFVIAARYAKPFFLNPSGIGPGEAYILYGRGGSTKITGEFNLNSVGTSKLRGVTLTGIRTVSNNSETDGLSDIKLMPDADFDNQPDLVFGFPNTNSAGQTVGPLEASGQFLHGGVVILSSGNFTLLDPDEAPSRVIHLGQVGQIFTSLTPSPATATTVADQQVFRPADSTTVPPTPAACVAGTDGIADSVVGPGVGFVSVLAPPAHDQAGLEVIAENSPPAAGQCPTQFNSTICFDSDGNLVLDSSNPGSGFYPNGAIPLEPRGARIIGPAAGSRFGTSISLTRPLSDILRGDLIVSAPNLDADAGNVDGLTGSLTGAGVAYLADVRNLWGFDPFFGQPPTPHQYLMGVPGHCGGGRAPNLSSLRIAGDTGDQIQQILALDDFNGDGRDDFAVGAPLAGNGQGRVYIAYRREEAIEGNFILNKLRLPPNDLERLTGILITTTSLDGLGTSLAGGLDFNGDGVSDLVVGSPTAGGGRGEVTILFGGSDLITGQDGIPVATLLATERNADGTPVAARITGNALDATGGFGFNIANAGDVDGDGMDDLLIAAPNATPRFDGDPTDNDDRLTIMGVDQDFNGLKDDVSGPRGGPDGVVDALDNLTNAGVVYFISSRNRLDSLRTCSTSRAACLTDDDCALTETCIAGDITISIDQLGTNQLRGFMIVGRRSGDRLGGGDAGDASQGGRSAKSGRGRSRGLSTAGDVDGDGRADILIGSVLADPRLNPNSGTAIENGGESYLIYGAVAP